MICPDNWFSKNGLNVNSKIGKVLHKYHIIKNLTVICNICVSILLDQFNSDHYKGAIWLRVPFVF